MDQPCVVAVVGRVKAGKSTFVNALLGQDLAKVGVTETTATINFFRYGQPHPDRPVRCHWRSGQVTDETHAFLDSLQGFDEDTLRRADAIDHLEYHLLNPYLEQVTLVDTPGTGAAVDEHQERVAEFMGLLNQLRDRHAAETERLAGEADAVLYLTGPAARADDQAFLDQFRLATRGQAKPLNAVGVLAKIDLSPELIDRRHQLAARLATQLADSLNTVVPVSAGLRRALDYLLAGDEAGLQRLTALRLTPRPTLDKLLASPEFFVALPAPDCPIPLAEREALAAAMDWTVLATVARAAADPALPIPAVAAHLAEIAGFDRLAEVLDRRFLKRGRFLRCYRIATDARRLLDTLRYEHLPRLQRRSQEDEARLARFLSFIRQSPGDPAVARDLETLVRDRLAPRPDLAPLVDALERDFARLFHQLDEYNADYEALQTLDDHPDLFAAAELDELRSLFGLYGFDPDQRLPTGRATLDHVETRQTHWRDLALTDRHPTRQQIADHAVTRYGLLLDTLLEPLD